MSFIAAAIIGGAVIAGGASVYASGKQAKAANNATALQSQQFGQTQADLYPWRNSGEQALSQLNAGVLNKNSDLSRPFGMQDFQESPAYQFNLAEGRKAIDKSAAARGTYYAPQTLQDIGKYSQGVASNEFLNAYNMYNQNQNKRFSQLYSLSGSGQNAAAQTGAFGANFANNAASNTIGAGNAQAAGIVGVGNAVNQGVGQGYNSYLLNQILAQGQGSTYGPVQAGSIQSQYGYNPNTGLSVNPQV